MTIFLFRGHVRFISFKNKFDISPRSKISRLGMLHYFKVRGGGEFFVLNNKIS